MVEQQLNSTSDRESDDGIVAEGASVVQGELSQDESFPPKVDAKLEILHEKVTKLSRKVMVRSHQNIRLASCITGDGLKARSTSSKIHGMNNNLLSSSLEKKKGNEWAGYWCCQHEIWRACTCKC